VSEELDKPKAERLTLPPFEIGDVSFPALSFDMARIKEAESRFYEFKRVIPQTYKELDYTFNCCYRDSKNAVISISSRVLVLDKLKKRLESTYTLEYESIVREKKGSASQITSKMYRDAHLESKEDYRRVVEEIGKMKVLADWFENKAKVMEKACMSMGRAMKLYERARNFDMPSGG